MSNTSVLRKLEDFNSPVTKTLQEVLTGTYGLYLTTHNYHWNVEGIHFVPFHMLFDAQYNELFKAVDLLAERIRSLNDYALPFEGDDILQSLKTTSNALNKENNANDRALRMVHNLIMLHEAVIKSCQLSKIACQKNNDEESDNLLVERITVHQKAIWMLKSIVK
jgi:starvation-inducible DNA-binding protein